MNNPSSLSLGILAGLQTKHVYGGTVDPTEVKRRRAANKVARRSRRINRGGAR